MALLTFPSVLQTCTSLAAMEQGKQVHYHAIRSGFEIDIYVGNALVDMYAKCVSVEDAHQMFDRMPNRNEFSWNTIIEG
jgi:pentatricopeptide repeat protein